METKDKPQKFAPKVSVVVLEGVLAGELMDGRPIPRYAIGKLTNTTAFNIGERVTKEQIEGLIAAGHKVTIVGQGG